MMTAERLFWNITSWDRSIHHIELLANHQATGLISSNKVKGLRDPIRRSTQVLANRKAYMAMTGFLGEELLPVDSTRRGLGTGSPRKHQEAIGHRKSLVKGGYYLVEGVYYLAKGVCLLACLVLSLSVLALFAHMITVMAVG